MRMFADLLPERSGADGIDGAFGTTGELLKSVANAMPSATDLRRPSGIASHASLCTEGALTGA
jgi:hypothetical protein